MVNLRAISAFSATAALALIAVGGAGTAYADDAGQARELLAQYESQQVLAPIGEVTLDTGKDGLTATVVEPPAPVVTQTTTETDAAAAATDSSSSSTEASSVASTPSFVSPDPGTARAIALELVLAQGWDQSEFACLNALWNRESGWRVNAANPSGAYGIPQALPGSKMAAAGADWKTNPATQIRWGISFYIVPRYGTPCGAWAHSQSTGWY